jgi:hypothetical protein
VIGLGDGRCSKLRRPQNGPSPQPSPPSTGEREPENLSLNNQQPTTDN